MATYKVIQDIEAEDKLIGPLTLKQFIYAAIVFVMSFIAFKLAFVNIFLITPFVPVIVFFGLLAAPLGRDQPNEVWILARVRFFLKPRIRKWDQSGVHQLVTITIPKKIERSLTKGYSPGEVKSRLKALANTIDTRGWSIKNVDVNLYSQPSYLLNQGDSDRLINLSAIPTAVPGIDISAKDDIFEDNNPSAQHINEILSVNEKTQRDYHKKLVEDGEVNKDQVMPDYWFMNQSVPSSNQASGYTTSQDTQIVSPGSDDDSWVTKTPDENSIDPVLVDKIEHGHRNNRSLANGHMHVVEPLSSKNKHPGQALQTSVTSRPVNAKISSLAGDNNLSVAALSHVANETTRKEEPPEEVVISLH